MIDPSSSKGPGTGAQNTNDVIVTLLKDTNALKDMGKHLKKTEDNVKCSLIN